WVGLLGGGGGSGSFGAGRLVDVHVRRLRTKVEADPANPRHVVTVRGLGYRLQTCPYPPPWSRATRRHRAGGRATSSGGSPAARPAGAARRWGCGAGSC